MRTEPRVNPTLQYARTNHERVQRETTKMVAGIMAEMRGPSA
jgi:hypothetical protein